MARVFDLAMTHKLDTDDFFIHQIQQHSAVLGLNFFLIEPVWLDCFFQRLAEGAIWAKVLLNMHSEHHLPEENYHRLVRLAHHKGVRVIDPPEVALAACDKARLHPRLVENGFNVPATIIVPREDVPAFRLTQEQKEMLGLPFVIKPSLGYGRKGVILDAQDEEDLKRSFGAWDNPFYLLQPRIVAGTIGNCPAYFRVYYAFGSIWSCWWNCFTDQYRIVTEKDIEQFGLAALPEIVQRLATLTGMTFFSTELSQVENGAFVLIDYVNDQCHMLSQSASPSMGVPDQVVAAIAKRLVEGARQLALQPR
ncbi:MAG: hypothetical protein JWM99_3487 [Verrucomicrobiales bacterium]|nr:hypothetical protein [Verrucomicrobiales bacterium]